MVSLVYPASINLPSEPWQNFVLFANVPDSILPTYIIFEVRNTDMVGRELLQRSNCKVEKNIFDLPLLASNGDLVYERWNCVSTAYPIGVLIFYNGSFGFDLFCPSSFLPILSAYFCVPVEHETFKNDIKQFTWSSDRMLPQLQDSIKYEFPTHGTSPCFKNNTEDKFSCSRMQKNSMAMIKDEIPIDKTQEYLSRTCMHGACTVEHDLAYLLPLDPFGMGLS